jgi:hypothetical protein
VPVILNRFFTEDFVFILGICGTPDPRVVPAGAHCARHERHGRACPFQARSHEQGRAYTCRCGPAQGRLPATNHGPFDVSGKHGFVALRRVGLQAPGGGRGCDPGINLMRPSRLPGYPARRVKPTIQSFDSVELYPIQEPEAEFVFRNKMPEGSGLKGL